MEFAKVSVNDSSAGHTIKKKMYIMWKILDEILHIWYLYVLMETTCITITHRLASLIWNNYLRGYVHLQVVRLQNLITFIIDCSFKKI